MHEEVFKAIKEYQRAKEIVLVYCIKQYQTKVQNALRSLTTLKVS